MFRKIVFYILTLSFISCESYRKSEGVSANTAQPVEEVSFTEYSGKIKPISLPLKAKCEEALSGSKFGFNESTISKFGQENANIFGKLTDEKAYTAILYLNPADIILPVIQTTDKKGNKISELALYESWCGEDEFGWGTSWAEITKDLKIILNDSSIQYKRNEAGEIIESTKKTEVRERVFVINDTGEIREVKKR